MAPAIEAPADPPKDPGGPFGNPALDPAAAGALPAGAVDAGDRPDSAVTTATADASLYNGLADGDINETYTITVTQGSTGVDHTTARLRVLSASGSDDDLELTPSAADSATDVANPSMPSSLEAAEIAARATAGEIVGAQVAGPLALDVAISPQAAAIKGLDHPVAGAADILLVPNIETGNALFKAMVYFMSATAAGLVLGARVPIILTSRADPPEARLAAAALAAILDRHQSA